MGYRVRAIADMRQILLTEPSFLEHYGPVAEERICEAEAELGLVFPPSYRTYLKEFGAVGGLFDLDLYGLPNERWSYGLDMLPYQHVVDETLLWREHRISHDPVAFEPLKYDLIEIGLHIYGDWTLFLDTSRPDLDGETPVLIWSYNIPLQNFASNFGALLRMFREEADPLARVTRRPPPKYTRPATTQVGRSVIWMDERFDLDESPGLDNARCFGLDVDSGDVFVLAKGLGLDVQDNRSAAGANAFFFANPSGIAATNEAFVAIDYILEHHPEIETADQLREILAAARAAYDRSEAGEGE